MPVSETALAAYYGCGWDVRPIAQRLGKFTKWHSGLLAGSSTLLVARADGMNWAITFKCDADSAGREFAATADGLLHPAADRTKELSGEGSMFLRQRTRVCGSLCG